MAKRGRPKKNTKIVIEDASQFDPKTVKVITGNELNFKKELFVPMKTKTHLDCILSNEEGFMPGTNMVIAGGPGSGKSTLVLDLLSNLTMSGKKCLFISGEMDKIAYFKYCKRNPKFNHVKTLFLKQHFDNTKETLEYVFMMGWDIVAIDSIAEVIGAIHEKEGGTGKSAEKWFLGLQDKHKEGLSGKYTTFINIQQLTKGGEFSGSNRLKHMTDAMCNIKKDKNGMDREVSFSKNRDCGNDQSVYFRISDAGVSYSL